MSLKIQSCLVGAFYGVLLVMFFYNLFVFISIREQSHLLYLGKILAIAFLYLSVDGIGPNYIWFAGDLVKKYSVNISLPLFNLMAIVFNRSYLETSKHSPRLDKVLISLAVLSGFSVAANLVLPQLHCMIFSYIAVLVTALFVLCILGPYFLYMRIRPARFYYAAYCLYIPCAVIRSISDFGHLPYNLCTAWISQAGALAMITIFSLGLADRINTMRRELEGLNAHLETIVEWRTGELTIAMQNLEEAYEQLKGLDRAKNIFIENISHEFRTPLTMILSPVQSLLEGDYPGEVDAEFYRSIERNTRRLLRLVNDLLDYSKIEAGKMTMRVGEMDIVRLLRYYISSIDSFIRLKGITVTLYSSRESMPLLIDLEKLEKISMNLFSNAIKFTRPGDHITIWINEDDTTCSIAFEDTGIGIPADKLNAIFERFTQVDSGLSRRHTGTGIGLALTRELVNLHGGSISVASRHIDQYPENHGTTFTVTLPKGSTLLVGKPWVEMVDFGTGEEVDRDFAILNGMYEIRDIIDHQAPPAANEWTAEDEASDTAAPREKILIVEDHADMRNFLTILLQKQYRLIYAVNGEEGIRLARESEPDLVITDVMMPVMDGYEMTRRIKNDTVLRQIPVLMLTAKSDISHKLEGFHYGADDYLSKPFNSKELQVRIKSLIRIYEYQRILMRRNIEIESDLETARLIQQKLLPQAIPEISGYRAHITYIPMDKVGGDFYEYQYNERNNLVELLMADVSGHGLASAFISLITKMAFDGFTQRISCSRVMYFLNDIICRAIVKNNFISMFYGILDLHTNMFRFSNAGHLPPLVYRRETDTFFELNARGSVLGWFKNVVIEESQFQLRQGDRLVIYTDGITECINAENELFEEERFRGLIRESVDRGPAEFSQLLLERLHQFSGRESFDDDLSLIVFDVL